MFSIDSKKWNFCGVALLFCTIPAIAANGHLYVSSSLGGSFSSLSNQTPQITYASGATITDAYPLSNAHVSSSIVNISGGYELAMNNWLSVAYGAGLYHTLVGYSYGGQLIETATGDPSTTLYDYNYNVSSTRLMAEMKLTWLFERLSPFITIGVGPAVNRMNSYTESPATSDGFTALPPFQSQTNTTFAYQAGVGLSSAFNFAINPSSFLQERLSIGYQYVNLGVTSFGTRGSSYPYHLNTGWLKTNDVYISYTHLF